MATTDSEQGASAAMENTFDQVISQAIDTVNTLDPRARYKVDDYNPESREPYQMGRASWDPFYEHHKDKDLLNISNDAVSREHADVFLEKCGYGSNIGEPMRTATREETAQQEMRAVADGSNVLRWWHKIRDCLDNHPDIHERLTAFMNQGTDKERENEKRGLIFSLWAHELSSALAGLPPETTQPTPLPENRHTYAMNFLKDIGGCVSADTLLGFPGHNAYGLEFASGHRPIVHVEPESSDVFEKPPSGEPLDEEFDKRTNPHEVPMLAPYLDVESLNVYSFISSLLYNRARYHPSQFASRDFHCTYHARTSRILHNPLYVHAYLAFDDKADGTYPKPYPYAEEDSTDSVFQQCKARGRLYSHAEGRAILRTQLYIYGFLWKLLKLLVDGDDLTYDRTLAPVRTKPSYFHTPDASPWPAFLQSIEEADKRERDSAWYVEGLDRGAILAHSRQWDMYAKPLTVDLDSWAAVFQDNRDESLKRIREHMSDLASFRKQADVQAEHHYAHIEPSKKKGYEGRAVPRLPHFDDLETKKRKRTAADVEVLDTQLMEELTKRVMWCDLRELEAWEELALLTEKLSASLRDGGVDLRDPGARLGPEQLGLWKQLQHAVRRMFTFTYAECMERFCLESTPQYREGFGRVVKHKHEDPQAARNLHPHPGLGHWEMVATAERVRRFHRAKEPSKEWFCEAFVWYAYFMVMRVPQLFHFAGFAGLARMANGAFELVAEKGNVTPFVARFTDQMMQLSEFVAHMEETRRSSPWELRQMRLCADQIDLPSERMLEALDEDALFPEGLRKKKSLWRSIFGEIIEEIDLPEEKRKKMSKKQKNEWEKQCKKKKNKDHLDLALGKRSLETLWLTAINGITGITAGSLEAYRQPKNTQKLLKAVEEGRVGFGLCRLLLSEPGDEDAWMGSDETWLGNDETEDEQNGDDAGQQPAVTDQEEEADAEMTDAGEDAPEPSTPAPAHEQQNGTADDEPRTAIQPSERQRPQDTAFARAQRNKAWADRGRARRQPAHNARVPAVPREKLATHHWDTFAVMLGKPSTCSFEDVEKAMWAIGFQMRPQQGSAVTVVRTEACKLPLTGDMRRRMVVHRPHAKQEGSSKNPIPAIGKRISRMGVTRRNLVARYLGGPSGGWR